MIDVCARYEGTVNKVFQDEGLHIQTLSVPLEKCKETCTEHQGCHSLTYCLSTPDTDTPAQCHLKTKIYHASYSVFKDVESCTTYYKLCT